MLKVTAQHLESGARTAWEQYAVEMGVDTAMLSPAVEWIGLPGEAKRRWRRIALAAMQGAGVKVTEQAAAMTREHAPV